MSVTLGSKVKDVVTGFKGIATARCEYLGGCVRCVVQGLEMKDGLPTESQWFDEGLLEVITEGKGAIAAPTGGPRSEERSARR